MIFYKKWRLELGISQHELSFKTKISRHRIQLAEQGLIDLTEEEHIKVEKYLNTQNEFKIQKCKENIFLKSRGANGK